ncbi:MAG: hypothetical protein UW46_C0001G0127 [Candidatus Yanofskybacteria bacterium GW2011_GWF1_44_227]|uniref:Membrane-bound metal-dependent hydrolase n=1 Tax=Candidatus Yanofskybacteria bacterium GW2011_GWE2_40_11 TaxID=1619033 RepID=A0A0G0QM17_9BACT|nr:MAG: hypothetical protein UT69_C0013G0056 [Candidatus Yanofskybacteria bacterium GW2011_GWE1_40_10]KKR41153.1 MAG: hypothetical protein UT75_C0001G0057 [Candidatus Yanofskybacteria bacterium GW2011_GWE2_40_11]KKT15850.1 MAG: hypothetical protein UV97_C0001G0023 [Candidatus Yanofskybacteria bacterium GW2011_GWF2_43_596]KKT53637.1 MAG: hypothetical protein UW46_C0001G0127 [Candidatus Yanofskybacteria bacterium GW2011_GWF1_44_227]OGN36238.1 MAG: hypothetical protein A2241_00640 [Candidatus Yano
MIMPGHLAAGYLMTVGIIKFFKPELDASQLNWLLIWGTFFGMIPDLDAFYVFFKNREMTFKREEVDHRMFISHAPLLWLVLCGLVIFISQDLFIRYLGIVLLAGVFSHFILDSLQYGVMWLWPFKKDHYSIKNTDLKLGLVNDRFFNYWFRFIRCYYDKFTLTFWCEIVVTAVGMIVFLKTYLF